MAVALLRRTVPCSSLSSGLRQFCTTKCMRSVIASPESTPEASPKIENLVNEISKLTLIEVSELNTVLKKKLNLPDAPTMAMGAFTAGPAPVREEEATTTQTAKTNYTVKLEKYDETKKVALIKEIKSLLEDMNLVQAKKFIESAPVVVKADIGKEEAEKLKDALCKHGAVCTID